jgi:hypothetical protein
MALIQLLVHWLMVQLVLLEEAEACKVVVRLHLLLGQAAPAVVGAQVRGRKLAALEHQDKDMPEAAQVLFQAIILRAVEAVLVLLVKRHQVLQIL